MVFVLYQKRDLEVKASLSNFADCEKKINLLMKSLNEMKDREAENFDKEIHYLELEKEFILKEINGEH